MNIFDAGKNCALVSLMIAAAPAMLVSNAALAQQPTTITWTGVVPGGVSGGAMVVTGLNGDTGAMSGDVNAREDGTFTSTIVRLEAHAVDAANPDQALPDFVSANWNLETVDLTYGRQEMDNATLEVSIDGNTVAVGDTVAAKETITIRVEQNQALPEAMVTGLGVNVGVILMVDPV